MSTLPTTIDIRYSAFIGNTGTTGNPLVMSEGDGAIVELEFNEFIENTGGLVSSSDIGYIAFHLDDFTDNSSLLVSSKGQHRRFLRRRPEIYAHMLLSQ